MASGVARKLYAAGARAPRICTQAASRLLLGARLRHAEREALHGLMLKLQHSDSKALQSFLDDVLLGAANDLT